MVVDKRQVAFCVVDEATKHESRMIPTERVVYANRELTRRVSLITWLQMYTVSGSARTELMGVQIRYGKGDSACHI